MIIAIKSLSTRAYEVSRLGTLADNFIHNLNRSITYFFLIKTNDNVCAHFLARVPFDFNVTLELFRQIFSNASPVSLYDLNKYNLFFLIKRKVICFRF